MLTLGHSPKSLFSCVFLHLQLIFSTGEFWPAGDIRQNLMGDLSSHSQLWFILLLDVDSPQAVQVGRVKEL